MENDVESIKNYLIGVKEFKDVSWMEKLNALVEFIQTNKRRPSQKAKEEKETRLGYWLSWQIQNRKNVCSNMVDQNIITAWDSFIKNHIEYFKTNEEIWYKKLEKVTRLNQKVP